MKQKSMVLLAVAGACGLVAMIGVQQLMSNQTAAAEEEEMVSVLVATVEIPPRTPLDDTNTEFVEKPMSDVPADAITSIEQYEGLAPKARLFPQDVVTTTKLGDDIRPAAEIPKGMRLTTVSVNLTKAHSGLITPGDYVDLQVTYQARDTAGMTTKSKTFMQNIEVFATDSVRASEADEVEDVKAKNISLLVTPPQSNVLKLAERLGEIHLVLRGEGDTEETEIPDFDVAALEELGASGLAGLGETDQGNEPGETEEQDGDVRSFLRDIGQEPKQQVERRPERVEQPAVAAADPEHEIWTLEIRAGEEVVTEEILVPIEKSEPADGGFGSFLTPSNESMSTSVGSNRTDGDRTIVLDSGAKVTFKKRNLLESASNGLVSAVKGFLSKDETENSQGHDVDPADAAKAVEEAGRISETLSGRSGPSLLLAP